MTVRYLFVYLVDVNTVLTINEVLAFKQVSIGYDGNPLDTTITPVVNPTTGTVNYDGANIWRDLITLYPDDTTANAMAITDSTATAANTYVRLTFANG